MKSRILMISTNRELAPQPVMPLGAAWVAQALHDAGFLVRFVDLCFEKNPFQRVSKELKDFEPDGIAISIRNLDNCDFLSPKSYLVELKRLADFIKSRTDASILVGGSGVSIMPMQVLRFLELDYAVVGEGEAAAVRFFQSDSQRGIASIPGVVSRKAGEQSPLNAAKPVTPRITKWVDAARYLRFEPVFPIQGKRGCENRCLYCTYGSIEGPSWRPRDPAEVVEEISALQAEAGAAEFEFVDSVFNQPEGYLEALLEEVIRSGVKARLHVSSLSPKDLTKRQISLMEAAGVVSAVITPESASGVILDVLRKGFNEKDVICAAESLSKTGIRALWCFLLGGPGETEKTLASTVRFINGKISHRDCAYLTTGIRIYPGTDLHRLAIREGVVDSAHDLLMPAFYFSSQLSWERVRDILHKGLDNPARCIFPSDTRHSTVGAFRRFGFKLGLPTPFWRYAGFMNRVLSRQRGFNRGGPGAGTLQDR